MFRYCIVIGILCSTQLPAQTLGGNAVFNFLSQPNTAELSALGGINVSSISNHVGMSFQNTALLREGMHKQVNTSFNSFVAGIRNYSLSTAWYLAEAETSLAVGTNYFDYGTIAQTDASGNILGSFRPTDYVLQVMASRKYHERFFYGLTAKYIHSGYGQYRSSGIAFDVGVAYYDTVNQIQVSVVAKNMGTQLKTYDGSNRKEELPFDLQAGITKRLADAPFQFSLTAHHLQAFVISYNDTSFRAAEGELNYTSVSGFQKIAAHFVLSAEIFLNEKLNIMAGYNFLRRQDLNVYNVSNGLSGFSLGVGLSLNKIRMNYATGFYQRNLFHQLSINLNWGELF